MPLGLRAPLVVAVVLVALLAVIGIGGTLLGWAAPSATAHAVETVRGFLGALGLPGETPRLPAARDMAAYWAGRGVADRGVVFAGAADASALLSLALLPLMVSPLGVTAVRRRSASFAPPDPEILRRGRLFGAGMAAFSVLLIWHGAHSLTHGDLDSARAGAGHFSASFFAPVWWALMALGVPGMAAALPSLVVRYVIRLWAR
ncbi:MAG: hypothetical protein ICV73_13185 [Acetobacteraceae bacterium]|nr:hypothetical protein [Acetobacteraceae bacterium]